MEKREKGISNRKKGKKNRVKIVCVLGGEGERNHPRIEVECSRKTSLPRERFCGQNWKITKGI